jgi:hypothetical protein
MLRIKYSSFSDSYINLINLFNSEKQKEKLTGNVLPKFNTLITINKGRRSLLMLNILSIINIQLVAHREHAMRWACRWQASGMMDSHLLVVSGVK